MNKSDNKLVITIFLFATVLLMSVGFAALNTSLTIDGVSTVLASSWDIHFANLNLSNVVGEATEVTPPTLSSTSITDFSVNLRNNKDSISYSVDVVNAGDYDAKISTITLANPVCSGNGTNAINDATNVCRYFKYTLTYSNGTAVSLNDILSSGQTKQMILTLSYGSDDITADELAVSDVFINNLEINITFSQA